MRYALAVTAAAALVTAATSVSAGSQHHPRYARHPRAPAVVERAPGSSFAPARMIEARPGVFISSYGCITDEGYGRWLYCGQGRGGS